MRTLVATESTGDAAADAAASGEGSEGSPLPGWVVTAGLAGLTAVGIALRFFSTSKLWLDEALSVNIAELPVGDLLEALRHDGHPPLYYVLLHYWIELFGSGDAAVRALSGVIGVATLPLAWLAGRRLGGPAAARWTLLVVALSPYSVRYSTETRMYSLVMLLVFAGYLVVSDALQEPKALRLLGIAVISGLLLLTHYWAIWLLGSVGLLLLLRWWRSPETRSTTLRVLLAVAAGGVLFVPWLPSFLYQASHTGTPWAGPMRPSSIPAVTLSDLGGGVNLYEAALYGFLVLVASLVALCAVKARGNQLVLDLRTTPLVRPLLAVSLLTLAVGALTAYPTGATFQSRYAAVVIPLLLVTAAVGASLLPGRAVGVFAVALIGLSGMGLGWNLYFERAQSPEITAQISRHAAPGDLVVFCPDQLGPAFSRELPGGVESMSYPSLESPEVVDWVDYAERQGAADPEAIADELRSRAGGNTIFVVWRDSYETFGTQCQDLRSALGEDGTTEDLVVANPDRFYESAYLTRITPSD